MEMTEQQLDSLKEMGNIGASHAASSLSMMLDSMVDMTVPEVNLVDIADITDYLADEIAALVIFEIQGELSPGGFVGLYMPKPSAIRLTNTMLGSTEIERDFNDMDESALLEVGNIMVSQFLDATATLLQIVMIPSPPDIAIDMAHAIMECVIADVAVDINTLILFKTELLCEEYQVQGKILLMPQKSTLEEILDLLDKVIQGE